jgi:hypothetical protein
LDILPWVCGIDQVMITGLESRPALIFLNTPSMTRERNMPHGHLERI